MCEQDNAHVPQQNNITPTAAPQRSGSLAYEEPRLEVSLWEAPLSGRTMFSRTALQDFAHRFRSKFVTPKESPHHIPGKLLIIGDTCYKFDMKSRVI